MQIFSSETIEFHTGIIIGCDGDGAIHQAKTVSSSLSPASSHFDILSVLTYVYHHSIISFAMFGSKGHQNSGPYEGPLSHLAILNIMADDLACFYNDKVRGSHTPPNLEATFPNVPLHLQW